MSKTVYYCATSLDGYIADSDDGIAWLEGYTGRFDGAGVQPIAGSYDDFYDGVGALVMGSVTYAFVLGEISSGTSWPYRGKPTWVLSTRELPRLEGDGVDVRFSSSRVTDLHGELVEAAGERDLWVVGGGNVASQFADAGLLDEVRLTLVPVVLGEGKPLFNRGVPAAMQLAEAHPFDNGMVHLRYAVQRGRA